MFDSTSTSLFFFFTAPATTEIYTLSLHDALPISRSQLQCPPSRVRMYSTLPGLMNPRVPSLSLANSRPMAERSEEHTSELQSHSDLVCRLLLEKKKKKKT